jgi:hypothetical protein
VLGQGDVPGVVRGDVVPELPGALGERLVGEELDPQVEEVGVGEGGLLLMVNAVTRSLPLRSIWRRAQ